AGSQEINGDTCTVVVIRIDGQISRARARVRYRCKLRIGLSLIGVLDISGQDLEGRANYFIPLHIEDRAIIAETQSTGSGIRVLIGYAEAQKVLGLIRGYGYKCSRIQRDDLDF